MPMSENVGRDRNDRDGVEMVSNDKAMLELVVISKPKSRRRELRDISCTA